MTKVAETNVALDLPPDPSAAPSTERGAGRGGGRSAEKNVEQLGQVFTPPQIVEAMLALRRNKGSVLEPACGDGAFSRQIADCVAIEMDSAHCPQDALNMDFFSYPDDQKFDTIIGNPPYVKARDVMPDTRIYLNASLLDGHANLYLHFIEKCVRHLKAGGELIFITPRDFLKATGAARLNIWLHEQGSITDLIDLGDARVFEGAMPNCAIWRFEKDNFERRTTDGRRMRLAGGQLLFTCGIYSVPLSSVFSVKVGAVSGVDDIFTNSELGNTDFVCSKTAQTGELRRMIFDVKLPFLDQHKDRLLARRVAKFTEANWWKWGRGHYVSEQPRIYVNGKTRNPKPFFTHECKNYDGAVLALFPNDKNADVTVLCKLLNEVDWHELGFVCDSRFLFAQRSLQTALLPESFAEFARSN